LERVPHGFETLYFELKSTAFLDVWVSAYGAYDAAHEALLGVIGEFALDGTEARLFG
jgi:hypothetical protein